MVKGLVALLVVSFALAGCASKGNSEGGTQGSLDKATTGSIAGLLVDPAIRPVAGALVKAGHLSTTSDTQGKFLLDNLAPGSYLLAINMTGYLAIQQIVEVEAGEVAHPRIQLATAVIVKPTHDTYKFKGTAEASLGLATSAADRVAGGLATCTCTFSVTSTGPLVSILLEVAWTDSLPNPSGPTKFNWQIQPDGNDAQASGQGPAPIRHEVQHLDFTNKSFDYALFPTYTLHVYPDTVWPAVNQDYQVFVTLWYLERPPADYSIVNGSPP